MYDFRPIGDRGISIDEVIQIHTAGEYLIYMLAFVQKIAETLKNEGISIAPCK